MNDLPKIYSRRKGTDPIPVDAVYVGRPTQWQNPYKMTGEESRDQVCDRPELVSWRLRLFDLIRQTSNLDWLLLTKRPENVVRVKLRPNKLGGFCRPERPLFRRQERSRLVPLGL